MHTLIRTLVLLALSSATILLLASPRSASSRPAPSLDLVTRTGVPNEWRLNVDGTVYLRLGQEDPLWFEARPTAQGGVDLETLLLSAILASETANAPLTGTGKQERTLRGASPEDALPLLYLERR